MWMVTMEGLCSGVDKCGQCPWQDTGSGTQGLGVGGDEGQGLSPGTQH